MHKRPSLAEAKAILMQHSPDTMIEYENMKTTSCSLHPKLQADLGDLIVWSSLKNDNQIILETHSEDLLLRVLKKIRKKEIRPEFVSANYVLKKGNKPSEIKKIKINADGQYFTPWKDDIFAERLKEFE